MKVLVGYASAHQSTKGIANVWLGFPSEVRSIDDVETLESYDVVLGSAIHNQVWLPRAAAFVRTHADDLAHRPVWLFSVSSVGETSSFPGPRTTRFVRRMRKDTKELAGFRHTLRPRAIPAQTDVWISERVARPHSWAGLSGEAGADAEQPVKRAR